MHIAFRLVIGYIGYDTETKGVRKPMKGWKP
jgi:hypothetical protein